MFYKPWLLASVLGVWLSAYSFHASADDHAYIEGPVVKVESIRTANGKFDEYMRWIDTTWKTEEDAAKKVGYVLSYHVLKVEPRTDNDPDLYLVVTYRNWAVLDTLTAKDEAIWKQVEGSMAVSNQGVANRGILRHVLGSTTMQLLELK